MGDDFDNNECQKDESKPLKGKKKRYMKILGITAFVIVIIITVLAIILTSGKDPVNPPLVAPDAPVSLERDNS